MMPNFRVWDKRLEILRPVASIDFVAKEAFYWIDKSSETYCYFTECILMQSTGLFDKNGKEIYEGDILKTRTRGLVSVRKESGNMMVTYQSGVNTRTSLTLSSFLDRYKVVVTGNIYENPELLEKSQEKWKAAEEGKEFLSLGEPVKVGHHSEKRQRP